MVGYPQSDPNSASDIIGYIEGGHNYPLGEKLTLMATFHDVPELADRPEMAAARKEWNKFAYSYVDKSGRMENEVDPGEKRQFDVEMGRAFLNYNDDNDEKAGLKDDAFLDQFIDAHLAPVGLPELPGGRRYAGEHEKTMKKARAMAKAKEMSVDASPQAIAKAKAWEKEQEAEKAQWRAEHGFSELPDLPGMSTTPEEAEKLRAAASRTTGLPNLPDPGREERKNVRRRAAKKSSHELKELLLPLITQVLKENTK